MLNGPIGAGAVCCAMPQANKGGYGGSVDLPGGSVTVGGVTVPRTAKGLLQQIGEALDNAIHGGDSGSSAQQSGGGSNSLPRSNVIEFPMVNPFKPVVQTRSPVTALTAFPRRFTYKVPAVPGAEPDDEQSSYDGLGGLGFIAPEGDGWPTGISLPSSGPSKLQSILGTIQATLPATIGALRAAPTNIYPGQGGYQNPYAPGAGQIYGTGNVTGGAVANVGSQVGGAVGNLGDTFSNIVAQHPYLILAAGAAAVLLFMQPPRRR